MIKFLYKINKKFDSIKEPKRFFIFMGIFVPATGAQAVGLHYELLAVYAGSWIFLLTMLTVRVLYINKAFHPKVKPGG